MDGSGTGYLKTVCDYVHVNPARARLLKPEQTLREYRIPQDSAAGRRRLEEAVEQRRGTEEGDEFKPVRRRWFLGDKVFKQELLAQVSSKTGRWHCGEAVQESAEATAERVVKAELVKPKWNEEALATRRKGDPVKVAIARRFRKETTVTLAWIAVRSGCKMGVKTHLSHLLCRHERDGK